jgi:hypothetical protein
VRKINKLTLNFFFVDFFLFTAKKSTNEKGIDRKLSYQMFAFLCLLEPLQTKSMSSVLAINFDSREAAFASVFHTGLGPAMSISFFSSALRARTKFFAATLHVVELLSARGKLKNSSTVLNPV